MKALNELTNTESAYQMARLFPNELKALTEFIKSEITHFRKQEEPIRKAWAKESIATADYWYMLIRNAEEILTDFNIQLYRSPRIFADQFFYSHNSVFAIHCLIRYAGSGKASYQMRLAIELFFGEEEVKEMEFNSKEDENTKSNE
ncbi:hypothetical protein AAW12_24015 [Sphingobacterium sp. Ag1]|uniref:hypothetical protein n=1 Tax=Sphingobacterium sp. Ag1 TaxID=1643451 RepID=UPI000627A526|nr:hypothetical protein [Sphingobacterium sp. Ag1]KKO89193.1 hypothetical protein AAW12_24015 [Sphingobacterium sp. Ag1]